MQVFTMAKVHTRIFLSNRSQAVRLPKPVALPDSVKEVDIIAIGNQRLITPSGGSWDSWFDSPAVSDDFMAQREQPDAQQREAF
jgi:antitoxin VapB